MGIDLSKEGVNAIVDVMRKRLNTADSLSEDEVERIIQSISR